MQGFPRWLWKKELLKCRARRKSTGREIVFSGVERYFNWTLQFQPAIDLWIFNPLLCNWQSRNFWDCSFVWVICSKSHNEAIVPWSRVAGFPPSFLLLAQTFQFTCKWWSEGTGSERSIVYPWKNPSLTWSLPKWKWNTVGKPTRVFLSTPLNNYHTHA